jgi:hypothetical protein
VLDAPKEAAGRGRGFTLVLLAVALAGALGAPLYVYALFLPRFITADVALADVDLRRSPLPPPAHAGGRTVLIMVDGLGWEYARGLAALDELRGRAATRPVWVEYPSFTAAALVTLATGLPPRDSGVRFNGSVARASRRLDGLIAVAADAGRRTHVLSDGYGPFAEMLLADGAFVESAPLAAILAPLRARPWWPETAGRWGAGEIVLLYFGEVDEAGHEGGAVSVGHRRAAERAAAVVRRWTEALDLERDWLLVVADHGQLDDRGHGGVEPSIRRAFFAIAGPEARRGVELDERPFLDVAATLATVAGLSTPAGSFGLPMLDLFDWEPERRARALAAPFDQAVRALATLEGRRDDGRVEASRFEPLTARLLAGHAGAMAPAEALVDTLRRERERSLEGAARRASLARLALFLVLLGVLAWAVARRFRPALGDLVPPALFGGAYALWLGVRGYRATFSKMPPQHEFLRDATLALACAIAVTAAASLLGRNERRAPVALLAGVLAPYAGLVAWLGFDRASLPPPYAGVVVLLAAPAVTGAAVCAVALELLRLRAAARRARAASPSMSHAGETPAAAGESA